MLNLGRALPCHFFFEKKIIKHSEEFVNSCFVTNSKYKSLFLNRSNLEDLTESSIIFLITNLLYLKSYYSNQKRVRMNDTFILPEVEID